MSNNSEAFGGIIYFVLYIAGFAGWCMNVLNAFSGDYEGSAQILQVVGIFVPPLGAVLGWTV